MAVEAPPKTKGKKNSTYNWLNTRPEKERRIILEHAKDTGAPIPKSNHIADDGESLIDSNGIRHSFMPKDEADPQENHKNLMRKKTQKWTVEETADGLGYNCTIPQAVYEANEKAQQSAAMKYRSRREKDTDGRRTLRTSTEEASVEDLMNSPDSFDGDEEEEAA